MFYLFYRELHPDQKEDLKKLRNHLISSSSELAALKVWELQGQFFTSANNTVQLWFDYSFSFLGGEIFSPHIPFYKNQITVWTMTMQIYVHIHVHVPSIKHYSPNQKLTIFYMQRNQRGLLLADSLEIKKKKLNSKLQFGGLCKFWMFFVCWRQI